MRAPRPLIALALFCAAALVASGLAGCPDTPAEGEGEGEEGEGEGEGGAEMVLLETQLVDTDADVSMASGFSLALRPDGRFAVAYGRDRSDGPEVGCNSFGGGTVLVPAWDVLVVDEQLDGTLRTRVVDSVPPMPASFVDLVTDPASGALVIAYTGGEPANGACQGSDLRMAVESGDSFVLSTVAANAGTGATCREAATQQLCSQGDCVGRNPGLGINQDGFLVAAYVDQHFCFGETDIFKADLDVAQGSSASLTLGSAATETGSGYNNTVTVTASGTVLIGHATLGNTTVYDDPAAGSGPAHDVKDGIYASVSQDDGTWAEVMLLERGESSGRVATAHRDGAGFALAWRDDALRQLLLYTSVDQGITWAPAAIEQTGNTGKDPALGFLSDGTLVAAYSHCKDRDDGNAFCSQAQDGVRIAFREPGGPFVRKTFSGDDEDTEGINVDMAIAPDDTVVVMSLNTSAARIVVQRFQKQ